MAALAAPPHLVTLFPAMTAADYHVGVFYEIQVASPLKHRDREYEAFHQVLAQVELAEAVGFHSFWTVEHHFQPGFSHCSAPEVLYGAVSFQNH